MQNAAVVINIHSGFFLYAVHVADKPYKCNMPANNVVVTLLLMYYSCIERNLFVRLVIYIGYEIMVYHKMFLANYCEKGKSVCERFIIKPYTIISEWRNLVQEVILEWLTNINKM